VREARAILSSEDGIVTRFDALSAPSRGARTTASLCVDVCGTGGEDDFAREGPGVAPDSGNAEEDEVDVAGGDVGGASRS